MKVKELIGLLGGFPPEADVRLGITWPDRVTETYENVWVGDYGGGPQLNAALDFRGLRIHVGCSLQRPVQQGTGAAQKPQRKTIDLGHYENAETAAKVRDFYVVHHRIDEPLNFPDYDYDKWIPPRTASGEYNEHIAEILREKLMRE